MILPAPAKQTERTIRLKRRQTLALAVLGWVGVGLSAHTTLWLPAAKAGDTACDVYRPSCGQGLCDCGECQPRPTCGCDRCAHAVFPNPIYQTLDTVAGGIERLFGLDRCRSTSCDSIACDGGCDQELIPVMPGALNAVPMPMISPNRTAPEPAVPTPPLQKMEPFQSRIPSVPSLEPDPVQPEMTLPKISQPKISQPKIVEPDPTPSTMTPRQIEVQPRELDIEQPVAPVPSLTTPRIVPNEAEPQLPDSLPTVDPNELPKPVAPKKEGSIFDSLDDLNDPFEEDARRLRRQYGSIRGGQLRPAATKRPAPAVGSGLKPAMAIEPLRTVSHDEPMSLQPPSANRRVLAPYRPSR